VDPPSEAQRWPRERWPEHPRFPEQALLLGSHDAFRNYAHYIRDGVEQIGHEQGSARRRQRLIARLGEHYADLMWSRVSLFYRSTRISRR